MLSARSHWALFRLQFYMNGHNWLESRLTKRKISCVLRDNAFLSIDNFAKAQELSDSIKVSDLHRALDGFARKYCLIFQEYGLTYHWSTMQVEYATDIVFKRQSELRALYDQIVRTASLRETGEYRNLPGSQAYLIALVHQRTLH